MDSRLEEASKRSLQVRFINASIFRKLKAIISWKSGFFNCSSKIVPCVTVRDEKAYDFYTEVKDVQPRLGAIVQGILSSSITDYENELKKLADASTEEWKRTSEAIGLDYGVFEFANWDTTKDYTMEAYKELKGGIQETKKISPLKS